MQGLPRLTPGHALFLDFDGTLVDIAPQPDAVRVAHGLIGTLGLLQEMLHGALAIVTGRRLADIDHYLSPLRLIVASEHGAHCRMAGDPQPLAAAATALPDRLAQAARQLQHALQPYPQLLLEPKTSGIALHYRHAPELESLCSALMHQLLNELPGMELLRGKCVLELKPRNANKGFAIAQLMQLPMFRGRVPIFVGDDVTDEQAFVAVQQLGGTGVKVGVGESLAQLRCETTEQVRTWLAQQAAAQSRETANPQDTTREAMP